MIIDTIDNINKYQEVIPHFEKAIEFLRNAITTEPTPGRHEIDGKDVFAIVLDMQGKGKEAVREAHKHHIDIHCTLSGTDVVGWKPRTEVGEYYESSEEDDYYLYHDQITNWTSLKAGQFAIFYPQDVHAALATDEHVKKIVIKIRM